MTDLTTRRGLPGLAFPEDALKRAAGDLTTRFEGILGPRRSSGTCSSPTRHSFAQRRSGRT